MQRLILLIIGSLMMLPAFSQVDTTDTVLKDTVVIPEGRPEYFSDSVSTDSTGIVPEAESIEESKGPKPTTDLPSDPPRKFSLVLGRTFMLAGSSPDSVPINSTNSGTYSIGGGLKFFLYKDVLGLRFTPGMSWTHIAYEATNLKTFPVVKDTTTDNITNERHVLTHGQASLSIFSNLTRDEDGDPKFFVEVGGYASILVSANLRTRFTDVDGLRHKEKTRDLETVFNSTTETREFERLRYGLLARFGYKWAALTLDYRLSDVFDEFTDNQFLPGNLQDTGYKNPVIPPIEVGLTIFF
ncbi:MAG: hypothetical protein AAFY71_06185 [Bacteroidota bacterium]